jgi:hypothetical protein
LYLCGTFCTIIRITKSKKRKKMRSLIFGFLTIFFVSLQAQDPFGGMAARQRNMPNQAIIEGDKVKIRLTVDGVVNNFALNKTNMFDFVYDSARPMGRIVPINFSDTEAIYRLGEIYVRGKYGAQKNYKMYTAPAVTTLFLTTFTGPLGLAFAIPAGNTPVKIENLGHPDLPLVDHKLYYQGYAEEARKIKARRVWLNFGVGFGIFVAAIFVNETMADDGETTGRLGLPLIFTK